VTWSGAELLRSGRELITKMGEQPWPQLVCVPRSAVTCVVAYFRRMELLSGVQEKSGILIRVRIEHIKDVNLQTKELGYN